MVSTGSTSEVITFARPASGGVPSGGTLYDERVLAAWTRQGVACRDVVLPGSWPFPDAPARAALAQALEEAPGPVVVDGLVGSCCPGELASAAARGVPVTLVVHLPLEAEPGRPAGEARALHALEQSALDAVGAIVVPSAFAADDLARRFDLRRTPVVARPGQDPAPTASGSEPPRLVMVGAFTPGKNHRLALEALAGLADRPWMLSLAGPEPASHSTLPELQRLAEGLRQAQPPSPLPARVRFEGVLTGAALDALWDAAGLLLLPSRAESYGMVVSEALARGVPALVASGTGAVEALTGRAASKGPTRPGTRPAVAGAALDPADVGAWREMIARWLDDAALREAWRRAALRRRVELPSWNETARLVAQASSTDAMR